MRTRNTGLVAASLVALTAGGAAGSAAAQETAAAAGGLEEMVVTARRREENLQEVPVSIEAYGSTQMENRGMEQVADIVAQTPNMATTNFGPAGTSNFSMRGIPNVGFFVDGIWQQSSVLLNSRSTVELERVELLRGPQGTLYGRDTTGGAIRLYTKKPAEQFGARVTATLGNYNRTDLTANVDIPVAEEFLTKWTISRQQRDGYVKSLTIDRRYGEIDDTYFRGDLLWKPTEKISARLNFEDSTQKTSAPTTSILLMDPGPPGPSPGLGFVVPPRQYYEILGNQFDNLSHAAGYPGGQVKKFETKSNFNEGHGIVVDAQAVTLNLEFQLTDSISLTSLSGWREQRNHRYSDFDSSEFDNFAQTTWGLDESWTTELQLNGDQGRINWVAGAFFWKTDNKSRQIRWGQTDIDAAERATILASAPCQVAPGPGEAVCRVPGLPNTDSFTGGSQDGYAAFGELTFDITQALAVTVGARYHDQSNDTWTELFAANNPRRADMIVPGRILPGDYLASAGKSGKTGVSFDATTYRFAVTYQFTPDFMAYFGYSEGFNSGNVERVTVLDQNNVQRTLDFPLDPEKIENYEIGLRSDWLDGRLRVNATIFHTDWLDLQSRLQITNPFTGQLIPQGINQNVAEAEAEGAELSITGRPIEPLSFDVGVGILDTGYTKIDPGVTSVRIGDKFGLAPKLQWNVGLQWNQKFTNGSGLLLRADYAWTDDYIRSYAPDTQIQFNNPGRLFDQESFGLLNARVVFTPPSGQWELSAFGTNLTNEFYLNGGFNPSILQQDFSSIGRPREYGLALKLFFGGQ